ncbi:MAG: acyl carrier protein [Prevotella sp.]|nr:acyl carrier protein [Bacteroides sp.]MCM1366402.1 acyl carrier protein [Prevotella sp.]MCM1436669.1 acyl carrier protein [Prevotella sp.]
MEIKEFIEKFAEIFDDTDASTLTPETNFRDLDEWSSLSALGVIALADEEFDRELSGAELRSANTIRELYNLITSK